MEGWVDEDFDLPGPHSQSEINQLQSDLARLRVECQHWRELAQQRSQVSVCLSVCLFVCLSVCMDNMEGGREGENDD